MVLMETIHQTTSTWTTDREMGVVVRDREAVIARARDLFIDGELPYQGFSRALDQAFAARDHADLVATMTALPSLVRITPASQRLDLDGPLFLRLVDGATRPPSGWQLAPDTTIATGVRRVRLDLVAASWDARTIHLRLETWGSVEVLVPSGVAVQIALACAPVRLERLAPPAPGAPVLRISAIGPTGVISVRNPERCQGASTARRKRRRGNADRGGIPKPMLPSGTRSTVHLSDVQRRSRSR